MVSTHLRTLSPQAHQTNRPQYYAAIIMSAAAEPDANDVIISRDCIGCDNCGTLSPQSCCSSCLSYYYCNRECQLANWKEHRGHCKALKRHREDWKERMEATLPNSPLLETIDEVCAICLEESIQHPVTLDCGHISSAMIVLDNIKEISY